MITTAIPENAGDIAQDCETTKSYTIVSGTSEELEIGSLSIETPLDCQKTAQLLSEKGAGRLLANSISDEFIAALESRGIQVFYGASGSIADGLNLVQTGVLDSMTGGCGTGSSSCGSCGSGCGCGS